MSTNDAFVLRNGKGDARSGGCTGGGDGDVDFVADFADDGVDGGDYECVLKALKGEMAIGRAFGVKNNFGRMKVYPLAGQNFQGDLSGFEELWIEVDWSGNVLFMQVPIVGPCFYGGMGGGQNERYK